MTGTSGDDSLGSAPRKYNEINEKLVSEDEDLVGMIAYALYKQSKREWLIHHERERGATPSREEQRVFVSAYTRHELQRLREQAKEMLSAYADYVIEQAAPEIREQAKQEHLIGRVDATLEKIEGQGRWWRQVGSGVLGALGYSVALLILALVIRWVGVDLLGLLDTTSR